MPSWLLCVWPIRPPEYFSGLDSSPKLGTSTQVPKSYSADSTGCEGPLLRGGNGKNGGTRDIMRTRSMMTERLTEIGCRYLRLTEGAQLGNHSIIYQSMRSTCV